VGQTHSLITILTLELELVQAAVDVSSQMLQDSIRSIDATADSLLARHAHHTVLCANLRKVIDGCKYACAGHLNWSVVLGRY
jgi:hypothetical protein